MFEAYKAMLTNRVFDSKLAAWDAANGIYVGKYGLCWSSGAPVGPMSAR